jgi:succinyl-CoA synthetase alpha subunit
MSILIDEKMSVLIQGITGREGSVRAELMKDYGTRVVAGVAPGKKGQAVHGIPVYDTVNEAIECEGPIDVSVIFIPAVLVRDAAMEALDAGVGTLVLVPDRVPVYDVLEIVEKAKRKGAKFVGPNTLGVISPGKAVLGMIGGRAQTAREWFKPGPVGVSSRSGGMTSAISYYLSRSGIGLSTIVHVGGDSVVGTPHPDAMRMFEKDEQTKAVVMFGEIGGSQEERVADLIERGEFTKPLIAYIGGAKAKSGTRFSHAGAIIEGGHGTHEGKVKRLREVGVRVVDDFDSIPEVAKEILNKIG